MTLKEVYLGTTLLWQRPLAKLEGKFTDDSTASDWWYHPNSGNTDDKVDISSQVNTETKEFAINDIEVTPWLSSSVERIDNIGNYGGGD